MWMIAFPNVEKWFPFVRSNNSETITTLKRKHWASTKIDEAKIKISLNTIFYCKFLKVLRYKIELLKFLFWKSFCWLDRGQRISCWSRLTGFCIFFRFTVKPHSLVRPVQEFQRWVSLWGRGREGESQIGCACERKSIRVCDVECANLSVEERMSCLS